MQELSAKGETQCHPQELFLSWLYDSVEEYEIHRASGILQMRVLVTGGAGFIGSNFVRMIASGDLKGYSRVTVLDKLTYAGVSSNLDFARSMEDFHFIQGDICDALTVRQAISESDTVINFAAESHVDRSIKDSTSFVKTNILGVQVILDEIRSQSRAIRFLQVSTDEIYGSIETGSWNEESQISPNSPYSATKAGGEIIASSYHRTFGTDVVITRCSNNFGTHHFPEKLIPLLITNLLEGKKLPIYGSGMNVRDWIYVDDHCRAIHAALLHGSPGGVYNIGGGNELSNLEVTKMILRMMNKDESWIEFTEDRKGHDFRYSVDASKIKNQLGFKPTVNFEDGLKRTIDWYIQNEKWWKPLK